MSKNVLSVTAFYRAGTALLRKKCITVYGLGFIEHQRLCLSRGSRGTRGGQRLFSLLSQNRKSKAILSRGERNALRVRVYVTPKS